MPLIAPLHVRRRTHITMNTKRISVQIVRWLSALLLCLVGLWALNLTAFNFWAAGGPPTPHPEIYERRGWLFFAVAIGCFIIAALLVWLLRGRRVEHDNAA